MVLTMSQSLWSGFRLKQVLYTPLEYHLWLEYIGRSSLQVTTLYNTVYNLSVVATAICRPNATAVITTKLW